MSKITWSYRLVAHSPHHNGTEIVELVEVYFKDGDPVSFCEDGPICWPDVNDEQRIKHNLLESTYRRLLAINKPILHHPKDFVDCDYEMDFPSIKHED